MSSNKFIIITEFFPPNNCAASNRVFSWANNMHRYGYFPVIFSKNDLNNEEYFVEKKEFYEVHYIKCQDPYLQRKRLTARNRLIRKTFGLLHYIFVNSIDYNAVKCMKKHLDLYISSNNITKIVATVPSYALFGLAHVLAEQHKIKWIADYRDDWTTSEIFRSRFFETIGKFDRIKERKYLSNCTFFTSVSEHYVQKIEKVIGKPGFLIENGYNKNELPFSQSNDHGTFNILYPGSLYFTQRLGQIGDALALLPKHILEKTHMIFLGTEIEGVKLPENCRPYLNKNLFFKKRTSRAEAALFYNQADVFLLITHTDKRDRVLKGIPSSKLYEYISLRKKVIVCPSDNDIIKEKLSETKQGIFCDTPQELATAIENLNEVKLRLGCIPLVDIPNEILYKNTREYQAGRLAQLLDKL